MAAQALVHLNKEEGDGMGATSIYCTKSIEDGKRTKTRRTMRGRTRGERREKVMMTI
jgi:hypothetical protein